ncbi:MAG: alpha/beta hydrolase [Ignavibacteriae bacterium]|nr:alpha/beta hydrolase [Ignavibacteriota bacterium]
MVFIVFAFMFCDLNAQPQFAYSKDSTLISYEVFGSGEQTLVFIHGWSCDSRYWRNQIDAFSGKYEIILIDLAGHGHSGISRDNYTMKAFGEDVKAVIDSTKSQNVILVGHSMGGGVIAEAALITENVIGLIGVDTYNNIEYPLTEENLDKMIAPLKNDFQTGSSQFVGSMFRPEADVNIRAWVIADMSSAPSEAAVNALENYMQTYVTGYSAAIFENISLPVVAVSSDLWQIDSEANRRHMQSFEAIVIENSDHFLMLNNPNDFNKALAKAIEIVIAKKNEIIHK